ncbi:hypothetical protein J3R83DRAFT_6260 [Lanmaoa asiatica]|nr:hypothetical protein J3R83DRAFT_6260 [Lanmaoa asiatica]
MTDLLQIQLDNLHPPDLQHLTSVYLALLISGGQIGLPIVVFTASVCRKVTWHPTIINFCVTWIVYSFVFSLYLYAGTSNENQHLKMCMVQASMIHGAAPIQPSLQAANVIVQTWTTLQCLQCTFLSRVPRMLYLILVFGTPYLVFVVFSVGAGTLVSSQPQSVCSNGLYCIIQVGRPAVVVPSFCAAVMVIILTLEAVITVQYYRQWKTIKTSFPLATRTPSRSLCFRVGLFCLYSCVTLTSAILFLSDVQTEVTYMLPAARELHVQILIAMTQGATSLWTTVLRGRKHSSSSFELEVPSARAASRSDPALMSIELSGETPREPSISV